MSPDWGTGEWLDVGHTVLRTILMKGADERGRGIEQGRREKGRREKRSVGLVTDAEEGSFRCGVFSSSSSN